MKATDWHRHHPGWLALAALALVMAVSTWPPRLTLAALLQSLQQARQAHITPTPISFQPQGEGHGSARGGFDTFSRATGTALPVLATVTAMTPAPPGPSQIVRCKVGGHRVYADSWTACPRGDGQLFSLAK